MGTVLQEFIEILTDGLSSMASNIGAGVNAYVTDLFLETTTTAGVTTVTGLSTFGGVAAVFGGVSLAVGLGTMLFTWIRSLGN